jgi:hypothetical protein
MESMALHLELSGPTASVQPIGTVYTTPEGTKARKFLRAVAKIGGKYTKPSWRGVPNDGYIKDGVLNFSADMANEVLANITAMQSDGISVKSTKNHEQWKDAKNTMGDVPELFLDEGWLKSIHEVRGEENIRIAEANREVSMDLVKNYQINGKTYSGWTIPAVSFVANPLAPGQTRLAASADDETAILTLQSGDDMKSVLIALGLSTDADEAKAVAAVEALKNKSKDQESRLSLSTTMESHPEVIDTRRESLQDLILSLDSQHHAVSPAVAKDLVAELCGTKERPARLSLSKTASDGSTTDTTLARRIYEILKSNKVVLAGRKSGEQPSDTHIAMGAGDDDEKTKAASLARVREMAGLPVAK